MARISKGCVYRPSRGKGKRKSRFYWAKYRDENGDPTRHALKLPHGGGVTDKETAQKLLADIEKRLERKAAGLVDPMIENARLPIRGVIARYVRHQLANRKLFDGRVSVRRPNVTIRKTFRRIVWICERGGIKVLADLQPVSVVRALDQLTGRAPKTINHYRDAIVGMGRWAADVEQLLAANPIDKVDRDAKPAKKTKRRAATIDGARRLIRTAPKRALWYEFAMMTGLRVDEIRQTLWGDLELNGDRPGVNVREETTKSKVDATQPLPRGLARRLREAKPADAKPEDPVFRTTPSRGTFTRDCERAGIDCKPNRKREKLDRHALRVTYITWVGQTNASPRLQQLLARHAPTGITERDYQDFSVFDLWSVMDQLPDLHADKSCETVRATGTYGQGAVVPHVVPLVGKTPDITGSDWQNPPNAKSAQPVEMAALGNGLAPIGKPSKTGGGGNRIPCPPIS